MSLVSWVGSIGGEVILFSLVRARTFHIKVGERNLICTFLAFSFILHLDHHASKSDKTLASLYLIVFSLWESI